MWNEYMWETYKKASGNAVIEMFRKNLSGAMGEEYPNQICGLLASFVVSESTREATCTQLKDVAEAPDTFEWTMPDGDNESEDVASLIGARFSSWCTYEWENFMDGQDEPSKIDFKDFFGYFSNENLAYFTTLLATAQPVGLFVPYYFFSVYNVLETIADNFEIELPPILAKSDYEGRVWHYADICLALYTFRKERSLSFYELCAFLYDFAPKYVGGIDSYILKELPVPKSAYFIGGGGKNADAIAEDDPQKITWWQCNPGTRAGDLIVMYLRTPISAISSIWRAQSVGFIDPFFWYYRTTYIGNPIKISRIPLDEIKTDTVLGKMAIVRKNMQGINGVELMPSEYNHIVDLSGKDICRLEYVMEFGNEDYPNEKAVEEKLIKPLLKKLGYSASEYVQQMYIEIGNHNHALIPDFVLCPKRGDGHQSGFAVIEAKRSIKNGKQLKDAKGQVRGYAKLLGAKYSAVASMEKLCVMSAEDDYAREIFSEGWGHFSDADTMYRLKGLIGKK